ncbi:MAG: bifunctional UDP-N-acetylglucosamine diphosphorylase/glucosamine-1-phosphate N-acetyltransferase GlmU [Myxococcota bacterium]
MSETSVIVLAAGQGTRMKSRRAKVLHELCGVPMLGHVLRNARRLAPSRLIVVVGRDADEVQQRFEGEAEFVLQAEQNGTGHAVLVAMPTLGEVGGDVLVLYGDTPLLSPETLEQMAKTKRERGADLAVLTARTRNIPGRVARDEHGRVSRIIEAQDATPEELEIEERNTGVYLFSADLLRAGLASLKPNNAQGELYITDIVGFAVERGLRVEAVETPDPDECMGINNRAELADATAYMRRRIARDHMAEGVTFIDPETVYIDADVTIGRDSIIEPGVVITGDSSLGEGCHVKAGCVIEESHLQGDVTIGPSAHLRPGSRLGEGVKIGNYVEIKNSTLGPGSKAAHLGYIGDADVGSGVNFSCGAIVVNYDGYKKTRSTIGDDAFIGCNANLVSPVTVEPHGFVAAGSTVTRDVPEDALAVARMKQRNIDGWVARKEGRAPARPAKSASGTDTPSAASASKSDAKKRPARKKKAAAKKRPARKAAKKAAGKAAKKKAAKKKAAGKATKKRAAKKRPAKKKSGAKRRK